jgi:hypothetical protein
MTSQDKWWSGERLASLAGALTAEMSVCISYDALASLSAAQASELATGLSEHGLELVPDGCSGLIRRCPSWLLPPVDPRFQLLGEADAVGRPAGLARAPRVCLWDSAGTWNAISWRALVERRKKLSWWFADNNFDERALEARVRAARPAVALSRRLAAARYPSASVFSINLTGSYLWSRQVPSSIDVLLLIDDVDETVFEHHAVVDLADSEQWVAESGTITSLDVLIASTKALENPTLLSGTIGEWELPDGQMYPYDNRRRTVASAVRLTLNTAVVVTGRDMAGVFSQSDDSLLALAYYFTQEASVLLHWSFHPSKAIQRLLEANLIYDHVERRRSGTATPSAVTSALRSAAVVSRELDSNAAHALASGKTVRGSIGAGDGLLAATIGRLSAAQPNTFEPNGRFVIACERAWRCLGMWPTDPRLRRAISHADRVCAMASEDEWPGWIRLREDLMRHPLLEDLAYLDQLVEAVDPQEHWRATRPERRRSHPVTWSFQNDGLLQRLVLWQQFGVTLIERTMRASAPCSDATLDAVRALVAGAQVVIGPRPLARIGDIQSVSGGAHD